MLQSINMETAPSRDKQRNGNLPTADHHIEQETPDDYSRRPSSTEQPFSEERFILLHIKSEMNSDQAYLQTVPCKSARNLDNSHTSDVDKETNGAGVCESASEVARPAYPSWLLEQVKQEIEAATSSTEEDIEHCEPSKLDPGSYQRGEISNCTPRDNRNDHLQSPDTSTRPCKTAQGRRGRDGRLYQCAQCPITFVNRLSFIQHLKLTHNPNAREYRCPECDYKSIRKPLFTRHWKMWHDANAEVLKCPECDYTTKDKTILSGHVKGKHDVNTQEYRCAKCNYSSRFKKNVKLHVAAMHEPRTETYKCEECNCTFKSKRGYLDHMHDKHNPNAEEYKCRECHYVGKRKQDFMRHWTNKHDANAVEYRCTECDYATKSKQNISRHRRTKHELYRWVECDDVIKAECDFSAEIKHQEGVPRLGASEVETVQIANQEVTQASYSGVSKDATFREDETNCGLNQQFPARQHDLHIKQEAEGEPHPDGKTGQPSDEKRFILVHRQERGSNENGYFVSEGSFDEKPLVLFDETVTSVDERIKGTTELHGKAVCESATAVPGCSKWSELKREVTLVPREDAVCSDLEPELDECKPDIKQITLIDRIEPSGNHNEIYYSAPYDDEEINKCRRDVVDRNGAVENGCHEISCNTLTSKRKITGQFKSKYNCRECNCTFIHLSSFEQHVDSKHNPNAEEYTCVECQYKTKVKSNFYKHIKAKHNKEYNCMKCNFTSNNMNSYSCHMKIQHEGQADMYKCTDCDYTFKKVSSYKQHVNWKHNPNAAEYTCNECSYTTKIKGNFYKHMTIKHNANAERYKCEACNFTSKYRNSLRLHMQSLHECEAVIYKCDQCCYTTKIKANLCKHVKVKHTANSERYVCAECSFTSKYKSSVKLHVQTMHEAVTYQCAECSYATKDKSSFCTHVRAKHTFNAGIQLYRM